MSKIISDGALLDTRPRKEKERDYHSEEVASTFAGSAVEFQNEKILSLPASLYSQEFVNACVPHAFFTQLEYEGLVKPYPEGLSQLRAYRKRGNFPAPGSGAVDMWTKIKGGQSWNKDAPILKFYNEATANETPLVVGEKLIGEFNYFDFVSLLNVPGVISLGKAVAIFIYATEEEWSREYVEVITPNLNINVAKVRHAVCLVPKGDFTENGKKWLAVHDSAAFGGRHLRYISLEFLLQRCYYATQVIKKEAPQPLPVVPAPKPLIACEFGSSGQAVRDLQTWLVSKGYLQPQYITGFYGRFTCKALLWFQLANWEEFDVNIPQLLEWDGKYHGKRTIDVIESL